MNKISAIILTLTVTALAIVQNASAEVKEFEANGVKFNMVYVEGGSFLMGSEDADITEGKEDETQHKVVLSNYYIGETEVSQALWTAVMERNPSYFKGDSLRPVESISWQDAQEFLTRLNAITNKKFTLPTEAEWEYAAKGGNKKEEYEYSGTNNIEEAACYGNLSQSLPKNSADATKPVASKKANALGIYDMSGNVYEWCEDWYYRIYPTNTEANPRGPEKGQFKVVRGGGWSSEKFYCRTAKRVYVSPKKRYSNVGMRLSLKE